MKPKAKYRVGARVQWKWLGRAIQGVVKEVHTKPTSKVIKGKTIKRNGEPTKPAYLVESDAGNLALKLHTELTAPSKASSSSPKLFRSLPFIPESE